MVRVSYRTSSGIYGPKDAPFPLHGNSTLADLELQLRQCRRREHSLRKCISLLLIIVAFCVCGLIAGLVATCEDEAEIGGLKDDSASDEAATTTRATFMVTRPELSRSSAGVETVQPSQEADLAVNETSSTETEPSFTTKPATDETTEFNSESTLVTSTTQEPGTSDSEDIETGAVSDNPDTGQTEDTAATFGNMIETSSSKSMLADLHLTSASNDFNSGFGLITSSQFEEKESTVPQGSHEKSETVKPLSYYPTTAGEFSWKSRKTRNETDRISNEAAEQSSSIFTQSSVSNREELTDLDEEVDILETSTQYPEGYDENY